MLSLLTSQNSQYLMTGSHLVIAPFRFLLACLPLGLCVWSLVGSIISAVASAKQMHRIPCTKCRFFTNDYRLKCTVKPQIANTEDAIGCRDYQNYI